ncbi:MAG: DUF302 domain-containing protein [gamma proteobacterium symbiont of Lucinoma myriamae]|nr:DUF302 domain-containing protein [gamma proteobacterium symbiont of Lucinoma myriamae]MCU7818329.1 DUF302 domain-containing protein [gamma proteobacterium symbiont of Lucinoma myriamae]MCU7832042.1 DUF302 domain-containing protein [gamma proteobacterium symbiont of Lucinoma myriamae]
MLFLLCIALISHADDGLVVKPSTYSVAETLDRMETIMKKKGITIFTRINHAKGAKGVGIDLEPTELLIFGNPKLGTPLMLSQPKAAIDLPLKAIAWKDKEGKVWLAYNSPDYIAKRHAINDTPAVIKKMTGALNKFSDFATKAAK